MNVKNCPHFANERLFTTWYGWEVRDRGGFRHKISDLDIRLKPFDGFTVENGKIGFIEFKVGSEKSGCDVYKKLRPNQIFGLRLIAQNWGDAYVIYYNKLYDIYVTMKFEEDTKFLIRKKIV